MDLVRSLEKQDVKILWLWIFFILFILLINPIQPSLQYLDLWAGFHFNNCPNSIQRKPVQYVHQHKFEKMLLEAITYLMFEICTLKTNTESSFRFEKIISMWKPLGNLSKLTPSFSFSNSIFMSDVAVKAGIFGPKFVLLQILNYHPMI